MNILYKHRQTASDSLSSSCNDISCCWEIAPLNHPAETQTAQSHGGAARFILLILWEEALATACVNLASQSTLPINNLSAYATLYGIFHCVCKPWKYAPHILIKHNGHKVHSLLTHQRNCSRSYRGRQSRRETAASSMGFALGEGSSSASVSAAKQPSLPCLLSLPCSSCTTIVPALTDRRVNVEWYPAGKTPRGCPVKAAEPSRHVCSDVRKKILYSAALPSWAWHSVCQSV